MNNFTLPSSLAAKLRNLKGDANFESFLELLDIESNIHTENLLLTEGRSDWRKGYLMGLRRAKTIVADTLKQLDEKDARDRERSTVADRTAELRRRDATFGSTWFRS